MLTFSSTGPVTVATVVAGWRACARYAIRLVPCAVLASGALGAAPATPRTHQVMEIRTSPGAHAAPMMTVPGEGARPLAVHQLVPDGARIDVPVLVTVVIASTDRKSTTTLFPDTSFTAVSTGSGERSEIAHGNALFSVVHGALDFFQVKYGTKFTASAKGTVFSIDGSGKRVAFACERGAIDVAYAAKLQIASRKPKTPAAEKETGAAPSVPSDVEVRTVEVVTPKSKRGVSFSADASAFIKTFGTPEQADVAYRKELASAMASGDNVRISAAYNNLALVDAASGELDGAMRDLDEAIRYDANDAIAYYNRGVLSLERKDGRSAIAANDAAIRIDPTLAPAFVNRGVAYGQLGDAGRALLDYDTAIRLNPLDPIAHFDRANVYLVRRDFDTAIAGYDVALRLNPQFSAAYVNRGTAYGAKGNFAKFVADVDQAIRIDPSDPRAYVVRATLHHLAGQSDAELADYDTAIRLDPRSSDAFSERGTFYDLRGDHERAFADYQHAIALDPSRADDYVNRGFSYLALNDREHAIADFGTAISLEPSERTGYLARGFANLYGGSLDAARSDVEKAAAVAPGDAYVALILDIIDRRSNMPSRLLRATEHFNMSDWPAPVVREYLGQAPPNSAIAAANDGDPALRADRLCTAYYYEAELVLARGDRAQAGRLYRLSLNVCPAYFQRAIDGAALRALGP